MNDPGLVRLIMEQLESETSECKFFESFPDKRSPFFCQDCNGKDYACEFYTPKYLEPVSLDSKK